MRSGGSQNASKIDKNEVRNAPGGFLEASRVPEREKVAPSYARRAFLAEKCDFGSHFGSPVDFEGGPKITFLVIMLEKNEKKEVRERFRKKHEIWMDF